MKSLLAFLLSVPVLAASAQSAAPVSPREPLTAGQHAETSCPIRAEEAYLSSQPGPPSNDPSQPSAPRLTLHVSLLDQEAKTIRSYMVHARISTTPANSFDNLPHWAEITRSSRGSLQAGTPQPVEWSFSAGRFTTRLQSVWFDKVVFSDGTTWNRTPGDSCTFRATGHIVQTRH